MPRFSDRTLDIDIVFYDYRADARARATWRFRGRNCSHAFVLKPLADLAPDFRVPGDGRTLAELWRAHPEFAQPARDGALARRRLGCLESPLHPRAVVL